VCLCYNNAAKKATSQGSSVSIVSDYGLDDRAIEVRSPAEAKDVVSYSPVAFNLFCSRTPRYNFSSSTLYPQSWYIMQVIHIV
jgi:hypothetical protein